ncbi:MAG: polysaccharide deacetylase family protein [Patescibacteria group bacterium]
MPSNFEQPREDKTPFHEQPETIQSGSKFDILKLGRPKSVQAIDQGEIREFEQASFAVTEYFVDNEKYLAEATELKTFFQTIQAELGETIPTTWFVIGHPSDPKRKGVSLYAIQDLEQFQAEEGVKTLPELNQTEFSKSFLEKLLDIQQKIYQLLEKLAKENDLPIDKLDPGALDPKRFKEEVVYSPDSENLVIANLFNIDAKTIKEIIGSKAKFEGTKLSQLKLIKLLGLGSIAEKIDWFLERSAVLEFTKNKRAHNHLNKEKMQALGQEGKKAMALTFDDGPNEQTAELLDILKAEGVKATFFLTGSMIPGREALVKRMVEEGHEVGVHEWGHLTPDISKLFTDPKNYAKGRFVGPRPDLGDIQKTCNLIEQITGQRPTMGRLAGAHGTLDSWREYEHMDLDIINAQAWDIMTMLPRRRLTANMLLKAALLGNKHGQIRLFHIGCMKDNSEPLSPDEIKREKGEVYPPEETVKMIREYIERSRQQGYDFVDLSENI